MNSEYKSIYRHIANTVTSVVQSYNEDGEDNDWMYDMEAEILERIHRIFENKVDNTFATFIREGKYDEQIRKEKDNDASSIKNVCCHPVAGSLGQIRRGTFVGRDTFSANV